MSSDLFKLEPTGPIPDASAFPARNLASGKDEWLTPPYILKALGAFDLDPCAPVVRPWPMAANHFTIHDNGLLKPWAGRVWLNPPYGPETGRWMRRLAGHGDGVALIFARTETEVWFESVWGKATGILFLQGRLSFHHVNGSQASMSAGAPSALIAYGERNLDSLRCKLPGYLVTL